MNRQKIIFLVVIAAVGLFIASIVGSMFATKQNLPNGYQVSIGGKETWVQSPDRKVLVTDVASVWFSADQVLVERRKPGDKPPFKYGDCDYLTAQGNGPLRSISKAEAQAMIPTLKLQTASSRACLRGGT